MGARYAIAANAVMPGKLAHVPRRVLITMALRALDKGTRDREPGIYEWGYERILGDIGIMPTRTSLRHLKADIAYLSGLGLLEQIRAPGPGQRAAWRLCLPVDNHGHKHHSKRANGP
jgi:hypothetical protein